MYVIYVYVYMYVQYDYLVQCCLLLLYCMDEDVKKIKLKILSFVRGG